MAGRTLVTFFVLSYAVMWASFFTVAAARIPAHGAPGALLLFLVDPAGDDVHT